jgi:hypothetical protein
VDINLQYNAVDKLRVLQETGLLLSLFIKKVPCLQVDIYKLLMYKTFVRHASETFVLFEADERSLSLFERRVV